MANFCKSCGAPLQGRRYCMNCGTLNEEPASEAAAPEGQNSAQNAAPSYTVVSSAAGKTGHNWLLIGGLLLILVVTICIVVGIVNKRERPYAATPAPSLRDNASTDTDRYSDESDVGFDWSTLPGGFDEAGVREAIDLLFPDSYLLSYDGLYYSSINQVLEVRGCRLKMLVDSVLNFDDVQLDINIDLSRLDAEGYYRVGDAAYYGDPVLQYKNSYVLEDGYGHTLEVYFEEGSTATVQNNHIVLQNVCLADSYRADLMGYSDPSFYTDLYLTPYYSEEGGMFSYTYALHSVDEEYILYLGNDFSPFWYSTNY